MRESLLTEPEQEAAQFLELLFGRSAPGYLTLWQRKDRRTHWLPATRLSQAAQLAVASARVTDIYVGMGLRRIPRGEYERGKVEDVIGIPSVWDDIDLKAPAHKKQRLPETREEALGLLNDLPLLPSVIVDSGWGIQAHWLLHQLWLFRDPADRRKAAALVKGFQQLIHDHAGERGWTLDSTHDLTRVLRIPGTVNRKLTPVPVRIVTLESSRRYTMSEFERILPPVQTGTNSSRGRVVPADLTTAMEPVDLDLLALSPMIRNLIRRGPSVAGDHYPSRSEAAWRVLLDLIEIGCSDTTVGAIFTDPANAIGEKAREQGRRWLAGEIARARQTALATPRLRMNGRVTSLDALMTVDSATVSDLSVPPARVTVEVA